MKIAGAIFDADGTLLDSMYIWENLAENYLLEIGIIPKENLMETVKTMSIYDAACCFIKDYGLKKKPEEIIYEINKTVEDFYLHEVLTKENAAEFLKMLKNMNVKMCIATASDGSLVQKALERNGIDGYFDKIFSCTEMGVSKNAPTIYEIAQKYLNTSKEETVVFEDALHALKTAKNSGFKTCGVYDKTETNHKELLKYCDIYLKTFRNAEKYFERAV